MSELTDRQRQVRDFMLKYQATWRMPPTMREIMDEFGISGTNGVHCTLKALENKGAVIHRPGQSRAWSAVCPDDSCPTCGRPL